MEKRKLRFIPVVAALAAAVFVGVVVLAGWSHWSRPISLPEASAAQLAAQGITLDRSLPTDHARISQAVADAKAAAYQPGLTVKDSVLARLRSAPNPQLNRLCWAVSVMPTSGMGIGSGTGSLPRPVQYYLVFVDARTGNVFFAIERVAPLTGLTPEGATPSVDFQSDPLPISTRS